MNKFTHYNSIEEMNDADIAAVMDLPEHERPAFFKKQLTLFGMPDSDYDAFREYHRWMSLMDDKYIIRYYGRK